MPVYFSKTILNKYKTVIFKPLKKQELKTSKSPVITYIVQPKHRNIFNSAIYTYKKVIFLHKIKFQFVVLSVPQTVINN
ncbi:hypothetical protein B0A79_11665 [Flavobacterium piscis]|uniref:Uncharacterized protein n=1 Tax=Flavobacterium piscis TaxID=1114874 RepID=A0ABX2XNK7_9FLAO|nr:hypothetical protein FLP_01320 [Flavobacterium piscis]OXG04791.1 hypothetical protein B0A79_11665 [Flavobacterium piscis]